MKKKVIGLVAAVSLFASVGYANNFMISGLGFVAPSIIGKSNIYNPEVGEIVYDSSDATFYGYDSNSQWQILGGGTSSSTSPTGAIVAFGGATAPAGYLICDGSPVSRVTYAGLYAIIGDAFGAGDGVNTFNLPDLRGRFLRGIDTTTDPEVPRDADRATRVASNLGGNIGNNIGSLQGDAIRNISGTISTTGNGSSSSQMQMAGTGVFSQGSSPGRDGYTGSGSYNNSYTGPVIFNAASQVPTGGDNRPKNVTVNYIIKI